MHILLSVFNGSALTILQIVRNAFWQSLSFQILIGAIFTSFFVIAYLYRLHGINKKNKKLFELNTRLMLEINEKRKVEKDLIFSKQRFTQLSQATFEALFITNKNTIKELNQSAIDMFGYSRDELLGMPINKLYTPLPKENIANIKRDTIIPQRATAIRKDSSVFFIELREKNIQYDNKKFKVWAITDISDKVEADKQKEILEQQLRHAQKMEAVGNLAGGVAHDFNNMLQVIMGFSEMAAKKLNTKNPAAGDISQIMLTTEKAAHLTRQLMTFSRKQTYQPQVVNINELIINLQNILSGLLDTHIMIKKKLKKNIPCIFADPGQIEQILINLIVNARDAINEKKNGSEKIIEIITDKVVYNDDLLTHHIDMKPSDYVSIEIIDNGCGMPHEIRNRVYEPFFTTKPEGKGTGLGLSTVYGIIKQNKASIDLKSEVNKGTSFKIFWPATKKKAQKQKDKVKPTKASSGNEIILFVEDEEGIRNFAVIALKQNGYKVFSAENGYKALQLIEEGDINFDLLISDLNMPGMDGDELVGRLLKKIPHLKALIVSGYGDDFFAKNQSLNGNIDFLQKPFSIKNLLQKVRTILDRN